MKFDWYDYVFFAAILAVAAFGLMVQFDRSAVRPIQAEPACCGCCQPGCPCEPCQC